MAGEYVVVYGDIEHSRRSDDRGQLARDMRASLEARNRALQDRLQGRFTLRAGADEFVGIVRPGTGMLGRMITGLWFDLHPEACRMVLVKGSLDVVPSVGRDGHPPHATDFDGEALWRADKAMRELKSRQGLLCLDFGGQEEGTSLAQSLGESLYVQLLGWTCKQLRALDCYARLGSQVRAAEEMGVHQATVSRSLSSIRAGTFLRGLREFQEGVDWLDSKQTRQGR